MNHVTLTPLEFAYEQSYGKRIDADLVSGRRELEWTGPRMRLPSDLLAPLTTVHPAGTTSPRAPDPGRPWPGWRCVLVAAFGPLRCEPHHPQGAALRAFPSPRAAYPSTAIVVADSVVAGYDPVDHSLVRLAGHGWPDPDAPVQLVCVSRLAALPAGYGPMREALAMLEAGHIAGTVSAVSAAFGRTADISHDWAFPDELTAPGLDQSLEWRVGFAVRLAGAEPCSGDARAKVAGPAKVAAPAKVALSGTQPSMAEVLLRRNSGQAPRGLTAVAAPMPSTVFQRAVEAVVYGGDQSTPEAKGDSAAPRVLIACERVADLRDGVYELVDSRPRLMLAGRLLTSIQAAYRYPAHSSVSMDSLNAVWFLIVDYPHIAERQGVAGIRQMQLTLGGVAQRLSLALAEHRYFGRPVRAFDEEALDALLGLAPSEQVGYVVLSGRARFTDFVIDLRT
jgi:hypothetical protein